MELSQFKLILASQKINEGLYLYHSIYDYVGIIPAYFNAFFIRMFSVDAMGVKILSSLIILINAIYFNAIVDKYQLIRERSFAPGLLVLIFSFSFYQNLDFTSVLVANLLTTLAVSSFLKMGIEGEDVTDKAFKGGVYLGLAFFCDQSMILFLVLGLIALQYYTSKGTAYIYLLMGWSFPYIIFLITYLFFGYQEDLFDYFILKYFFTETSSLLQNVFYTPWWIFSFLILILFFVKKSSMSFKNYISKAHQIFIFWLILVAVIFLIIKDDQASNVYLLANPLGFMASFYLLNVQKKWIKEGMFFLILMFAISFNFLIEQNPLVNQKAIKSTQLKEVSQRYDGKVLALFDEPSIYKYNQHGSSFTNWNLEKGTFLNLMEYGNLEKIYIGIIADYPKYIIDPNGIFERVMEKVPLFRKRYKKLDSRTYRLIEE